MTDYFSLKYVIRLTVAIVMLLLAACTPSYEVTWDKAQEQINATIDANGDVLILGGSVMGPSGRGGQAQWAISTGAGQVNELTVTIFTNGQRWRGKGIHSTRPNGTVDIYVNNTLVHTIVCNNRGAYEDYWPQNAPVGSPAYETGTIDVSGQGISGPILALKIITSPYTALDINKIKISVTSEGT